MSIVGYALREAKSGNVRVDGARSPEAQRSLIEDSRLALQKVRGLLQHVSLDAPAAAAQDAISEVDASLAAAVSVPVVAQKDVQKDGLARVINTIQALVPAEVLLLNSVVLQRIVRVADDETVTISSHGVLNWITAGSFLLVLVIYWATVLISRRGWQRADYWRILIPVGAYFGWSLLQPVSAFVYMEWFSNPDVRLAIGCLLAVLIGVVVNLRDELAKA